MLKFDVDTYLETIGKYARGKKVHRDAVHWGFERADIPTHMNLNEQTLRSCK